MREMVNGLISVGHLRSGKLNLMVNRPTVKSSTGLINRTGRGRLDDHGCEDHRLTESVRRLGQIRLSSVSDRSTAVTGLKRSSSSISQTTPVADRISLRSNGCFRSDFGLLMRPGNLRDRMRSKPLRRSSVLTSQRSFRQTSQRNDLFGFGVFSCSVPMFKSCLLSLTRATLIVLPFWYRWRLSRHFPRASRTLLTIPIFAMCLIIAIGIDQSPRTSRWRLLLMTESEEVEWSHRRFEDLLEAEGHLVLGADDPRTRLVKSICDRLMTAIDVDSPVSAATWPRDHIEIKEKMKRIESRKGVSPSATTGSAFMPWRPESSNPEKILDSRDWHLFIIDLPKINAFVLPTKEIFVYSGLLELLDRDEDLTAAILAHEVSHVLERHSVENMGFSALSAVLFDALRGISFALTISFPLLSDGLATFINYLNNVVAERAYSRKLETEADELGLSIMAKAGYDPRAALSLWGLLNEVEQEQLDRGTLAWSDKIPWTRTHPTGKDREKAIIKGLPKAMAGYQKTIKEKIESEKILLIDNNNDKKNNNTKNYDNGDNNRDIVNVKKDKTKK